MFRNITKLTASVFIIFISAGLVSAQSTPGVLTGTVVDQETGEPLPGVNIVVEGSMKGAATDLDGKYKITSLAPGVYTIVASYIGYSTRRIEAVEILSGKTAKIDFSLGMEVIEGKEVVVTAKALRDNEAGLLKERQKSVAVSDAVSAEAISQAGAGNAAEAMKQVTGASVVGGKYVYVRGLGDRYTSTMLNGAEIPSTDPYRRTGSIDLIPSNLIDYIVTLKSFTPDKQGSFSGGAVDIKTKDFPDRLDVRFSASSSFNTQTTLNKDGALTYRGGSRDWLAMDDGTRALPENVKGPAPSLPSKLNPTALDALESYSRSFNPIMTPSRFTPGLNQSYSFSIGNQFGFLNRPLGYLASFSYGRSTSAYSGGQYNAWVLGSAEAQKLTPIFAMEDAKTTQEVLWGGLFKTSYKLNPNNIISFNYLYNRNGESTAQELVGQYDYDRLDRDDLFQSSMLGYSERRLSSHQLDGEHLLPSLFGAKVAWKLSASDSRQNEPDLRYFSSFAIMDNGRPTGYGTFANIAPTRFFRTLNEKNNEASLDITVPFRQWNGKGASFKFGGFYNGKERDFEEQRFVYNEGTGARHYYGDPVEFFAPNNVGWDSTSQTINGKTYYGYELKLYITATNAGVNDYTADQDISAWYGMVDLPLFNKLRFVGGARYEQTTINMISLDERKEDGRIETRDWLPSLNLIYSLGENMNLRTSVTRTLARPNFRELAPYASFDFAAGFTHIGNPALRRTLIDNYDFRWEWFSRPGEIYAASLFYKNFQNPIERSFIVESVHREITWENVDRARVMGIELEARKHLDVFYPGLENFLIGANLSLVYSEIDITEKELAVMRENNPNIESTRMLEGQSPYILNLNVGYANFERGLSAHIYFNVFGKRLSEVNKSGEPFVYEVPANSLNLTLSKSISNNLNLKLSASNLLDAKYKKTQTFNDREYIFRQYTTGRTFSLGLGYSL